MSVSREEVIFAYRLLLDRMPESELAIQSHTRAENLQKLLDGFIRSPEFLNKAHGFGVARLPLNVPSIEVDTDASDTDVAACLAKIRAAWTHLGTLKPHFSVLTEARYLPENIAHSAEEFWASGEVESENVKDVCQRFGLSALAAGTCVEFGCGVGRVTMGLARLFGSVHGYDISATHLEHAVNRARTTQTKNIIFHLCADNVLENLAACDLFYSAIVFQHNPPVVIGRLIRNALKSLKNNGLAIFQVPTYALGYRFKTSEWLAAEHILDMQMHCFPQANIFNIATEAGCRVLEVREDEWAGPGNQRLSNTFVIRKSA
jgi:SAM-dependent methyltransferase